MSIHTKRISLWSGPRNISTTLMYSFAQRSDTKVFDEPLYGHYLTHSKAREYHPGADEIMNTTECDGQKVVNMMLGEHDSPVVFFKNMSHHLLNLEPNFLQKLHNIILTRDPVDMLPSFDKVIPNPTMEDVGYAQLTRLVQTLRSMHIEPIVLDSKRILMDPEGVLRKLCSKLEIPFENAMLSWPKGARSEDGCWARYWYHSVHNSTGYQKYTPKSEPFPDHLKPLLADCLPYYMQLIKSAF